MRRLATPGPDIAPVFARSAAVPTPRSEVLRDAIVLLVLAGALRLLWLGQAGLWADELFSVYWSQLDVHFLLGEGARIETNPPTYFLLLRPWIAAFGDSAWSIRLLSVPPSVATVLVTYAIGRRLLDRPTALLAGVLIAVNPTALMFAQQARPYAVLGLLQGLALLALASAAQDTRFRWRWPVLFTLAAVGAFFLHYTAVLFIGAGCAVMGLHILTARPFVRRAAVGWAAAAAAVMLAIAWPLIASLGLSNSANLAWIGPMTPWTVGSFFLDLLTHPASPRNAATMASAAVLLVLLAVALPRLRLNRVQIGVLVLVPAAFCLLAIGASVARPVLLSRIGLWMIIPLCLLLARAAVVQPGRARRAAFAVIIGLTFLVGVRHYFTGYGNEDWRGLALRLATEPQCPGPVLVTGDNALGLHYYDRALEGRPVSLLLMAKDEGTTSEFALTQRVMHPGVLDAAAVPGFVGSHSGTTVVLRSVYLKDTPQALQDFLAQAPFHADLAGGLLVSCYPRR